MSIENTSWTKEIIEQTDWNSPLDSTVKLWDDPTVFWDDPNVYWDGYISLQRSSDTNNASWANE